MSLEQRIQALVVRYRAEAQKLELEGVAARRLVVREALQGEAQRYRLVADELEAQLELVGRNLLRQPFGVPVPVLS